MHENEQTRLRIGSFKAKTRATLEVIAEMINTTSRPPIRHDLDCQIDKGFSVYAYPQATGGGIWSAGGISPHIDRCNECGVTGCRHFRQSGKGESKMVFEIVYRQKEKDYEREK